MILEVNKANARLRSFLFSLLCIFLLSCAGQGPLGVYNPGGSGNLPSGEGGGGSGGGGTEPPSSGGIYDGNPATRPTPGFTEVALAPATSTSDPSSATSTKALLLNNGIVTIDEVRMHLQDISLLNDGGTEVLHLSGPFIVRLLKDQVIVDESFPEFGGGVIPNDSYHELQLRFSQLQESSIIPEELLEDLLTINLLPEHTMVITGSLRLLNRILPGFLTIPFQFFSSQENIIQILSPNDLVTDGTFFNLFIAFKIQQWFDNDVAILLGLLDPLVILQPLVLEVGSNIPLLNQIAELIELNINQSLRLAPSLNDTFEEGDVDELSTSESISP
jgi:hypothetical protein